MLFLYGTLLDLRLFTNLAGRPPPRGTVPATLPAHRRVHLRGTPYPTLVRGDGAVLGVLLPRLAAPALARLAAYEGGSYALAPVRVTTRRGARRARAWMAARWRADLGAAWLPRANVTNPRGRGAIRSRVAGGFA